MEFAASKNTGVFGPRIVQFNNPAKLEAAWGKVSWSHVLAKYYGKNDLKTDARWEETRNVELLLGSVLLVHHEVFEEVGLFDERFFLYHEEVDFLYRTYRSGFPVFYCPFAEAIHHGAHSTRRQPLKKIFWVRKNAVYFLRKHNADSRKWIFFWSTLAMSLLYNTMRLRWSRVSTIWKAVKEGLEI
jgi:GT2 family glycosyltransferase